MTVLKKLIYARHWDIYLCKYKKSKIHTAWQSASKRGGKGSPYFLYSYKTSKFVIRSFGTGSNRDINWGKDIFILAGKWISMTRHKFPELNDCPPQCLRIKSSTTKSFAFLIVSTSKFMSLTYVRRIDCSWKNRWNLGAFKEVSADFLASRLNVFIWLV